MSKMVLLGASGYIGQAFQSELNRRGVECISLTRSNCDYTHFQTVLAFLQEVRPVFLINAAGYTGKPNVDACETARADTLLGNALFPQTLAHACLVAGVPWGHVSSGCIYSGAWVEEGGRRWVEKDLTQKSIRLKLADPRSGITLGGFTETDEPNFSFRNPPCSFYSGTKALGEEVILKEWTVSGDESGLPCYIWRLRIPFDEFDNSRNYLTKVQRYAKVYDNFNSLSHRGDFVRACLGLWDAGAPGGIYNVTNPGYVSTRQVVGMIRDILKPDRKFEYWESDEEFYRVAAKTPRSNCVLDTSKLLKAGVKMRSVEEALEDSLRQWKRED